MAYIIPNATETGSGQKYANINQAEPDSVDIEALGNRPNWVRNGCEVSIVSEEVTVTEGTVVINNVPYAVSAVTTGIPISRATVGARTDLVVARRTGSAVSVQVITGIDTATNPIFPRSKSVVGNLFNSAFNYDPDNDILLASVYVTSAETDGNNIVDKRIVSNEPVIRYSSSAATPTSTGIDVIGDVVVASNGIVYVKTGPSTWEAIATRTYADTSGFPIGSVFAWAGQTGQTPGANYLECNGQEILKSSYNSLYNIIGDIYGTSSNPATLFKLPNLSDDRTIIGASSNYGSSGGANSLQLTVDQMPSHKHDVSVPAHGDNGVVGHTGGTATQGASAATGGNHFHQTNVHFHDGALAYRHPSLHNNHHVIYTDHSTSSNSTFHVDAINVNESNAADPWGPEVDDTETTQTLVRFKQNSNPNTIVGGGHSHAVTVNAHSGLTHTGLTEQLKGSGSTVNTLPKHVKMRWFIRAI